MELTFWVILTFACIMLYAIGSVNISQQKDNKLEEGSRCCKEDSDEH